MLMQCNRIVVVKYLVSKSCTDSTNNRTRITNTDYGNMFVPQNKSPERGSVSNSIARRN